MYHFKDVFQLNEEMFYTENDFVISLSELIILLLKIDYDNIDF